MLSQICLTFVLRHWRCWVGTEPVQICFLSFCALKPVKYNCLFSTTVLIAVVCASVPSCRRHTYASEAACVVWLQWASWGTAANPGRDFAADGDLHPRNLDSRSTAELCQPGLCSSAILSCLLCNNQVFSSILHFPVKSPECFLGLLNLLFFFIKSSNRYSVQYLRSQCTLDVYYRYSLLCPLHWMPHWIWWGLIMLVLLCPRSGFISSTLSNL